MYVFLRDMNAFLKTLLVLLCVGITQPVYSQVALSDKIGQMLMVGFTNFNAAKDTLINDIQHRNLGGVLYFGYNIQNPSQIKLLNAELQGYATTPLLLATDQEGGRVARLGTSNGYTATNSAQRTGIFWASVDSTRHQARRMAGWFTEAGLNTNLAPVVDVNVNPNSPAIGRLERSYSSNPENVAEHALAFMSEFNQNGIVTALKHFPGHGSAVADSHFGFTDITNTWQPLELTPYVRIIEQIQPDMIMTGHLFHQRFDSNYPASLSQYFINDLLRDSMGYDGVIISDEMFMRAIRDHYTFDEAIVRVINSGTDILLFNNNRCSTAAPCGVDTQNSLSRYVINLVLRKIDEGVIAASRIDEAYNRIIKLKERRVITDIEKSELPISTKLHQNYPNPFNPTTTISFELSEDSPVSLSVYDVLGREMMTIASAQFAAGTHSISFDASTLASGIYLYRLQTSNTVLTRKMSLVK